MAVQGHPRSLILAPLESAYATSYQSIVILVLSCILLRFRDIAGFLLKTATPPYFTRILGCSPWTRALTRITCNDAAAGDVTLCCVSVAAAASTNEVTSEHVKTLNATQRITGRLHYITTQCLASSSSSVAALPCAPLLHSVLVFAVHFITSK